MICSLLTMKWYFQTFSKTTSEGLDCHSVSENNQKEMQMLNFKKKNANPVQAILSWLNCLRCDRSSRVPDDRCQSFGRRSRCRQIDVYARWREVLVCSFLSVCDNNTILAGVRKLTFRLLVVSSDVCHLLTITIKQARHLLFYGLWLNKLSRSFSQHQSLQFFYYYYYEDRFCSWATHGREAKIGVIASKMTRKYLYSGRID